MTLHTNHANKGEILAYSTKRSSSAPRTSLLTLVVAVSLLGVVAATAVVPGDVKHVFSTDEVFEALPTPAVEVFTDSSLPFVFDERIQPGDTVQAILNRIGVRDPDLVEYMSSLPEGRLAIKRMRAGRSIVALVTSDGKLVSMQLPIGSSAEKLIITRNADHDLQAQVQDASSADVLVEMHSGVITHSLFGATDEAGVPDSIANRFADIFGTEIDFSRDIRKGDSFSVVYETVFDNGVPVGTGRILAAEFVNQGKKHAVVRYREPDGNETYYKPDGTGLNQAFLRYPLEFTRVSSSFGRRFHPIHRNWRSHNGTDFAAPRGTPVKASSDGKVDFLGTQRGYGKTIVVDHRDSYSTLYAHMNGFAKGLKKGQRIRQGDVIGYVGSTGWATGPHLHYEIRIKDVPHDPMKIALPPVQPLNKQEMAEFKRATSPYLQRLAMMNRRLDTELASAE